MHEFIQMKKITRSLPLLLTYMLLSCGAHEMKTSVKSEDKKPNVVFIAVDDLRPELGAYGNNIVKTPNIDKLAANGTTFINHYVQVPTCGASRYSLMTGMRPHIQKQLSNNAFITGTANKPEGERPESFIHQLRRNGYRTVGIGKISHSPDGLIYDYEEQPSDKMELPYSWDEFLFDSGKWGTGWNAFFAYANGENRQSMNLQVKPYEIGEVDDKGYPDGLTADLAVSKLRELNNNSEPFFLGVGFIKPHLPFNSPKKYWDLYVRADMPLTPNPFIPKNVNKASLHNSGEFNSYKLTDEIPSLSNPVSDNYSRKLVHAYYAAVSYVDAQIGKVLDEIIALDLEDNTIVVIWGDHGWHLGEDLVWGKHTLFDVALKSPLIIKVPGTKSVDRRVTSIVETVDIYPTLLELCGVNSPGQLDGESFAQSFEKRNLEQKNVAYSFFNEGISVRTDRYRLTKYWRNDEPTIELYDYKNDPWETQNIAIKKPKLVQKLMPLLELGNTGLYGQAK